MINLDGDLVTDDMTFACVLSLHGFELILSKGLQPGQAVWTVEKEAHDRDMRSYVREYKNGMVRVEPKRFMTEIRKVRKELYKFLEHEPTRVSAA